MAALVIGLFLPGPLAGQQRSLVPSGAACDEEYAGRTVAGVVLDLLTGRPLAGIPVTLQTVEFDGRLLGTTVSEVGGTFRFCDVAWLEGMVLTASAQSRASRQVPVPESAVEPIPPLYLEWSEPIDLVGVVVDAGTGAPLAGAVVQVEGRPARSITDEAGRFRVSGQGSGQLRITTSFIGYASRTDSIDTSSGDRLDLEIRLDVEAIALEPVVVRVRSAEDREARAAGVRFDVLSRAKIDSLLVRASDAVGLLRWANFPGVLITEDASGSVCVGTFRMGGGCNMVAVYIDGIHVNSPEVVLPTLNPDIVERIEFYRPLDAVFRFGERAVFGALLIHLR